ncbi:MAG: DUF3047 domain-containing protein [Candidatus Omnitrophica bacterium]|nr:DUF3047 domain-containing protein [Candidatus Omnitrophota bacterium]
MISSIKRAAIIAIVTAGLVAIATPAFFTHLLIPEKEAAPLVKREVVPVPEEARAVGWREEFDSAAGRGRTAVPKGWKAVGKPGTKPAVFSVRADNESSEHFLHVEADRATGNLMTRINDIDLKKTPVLRWRWRATTLPAGADGRLKAADDQVVAIYVGTGTSLNNKSISYRWDTETPRGAEGNASYGMGGVKVKWYTLRNKADAQGGQWLTEERNVAEDFNKAWGFYPEKIYLSVSSNSQYTRSSGAADLCWIEFVSLKNEAI